MIDKEFNRGYVLEAQSPITGGLGKHIDSHPGKYHTATKRF